MNLPVPSFTLIGYAAITGLILGSLGGWRVTSWAEQAHELSTVKAALVDERKQSNITLQRLQSEVKTAQTASKGYQDELAILRAQPRPIGSVRLCVPAHKTTTLPAATEAQPGSTGPSAAPGRISPADGQGDREGQDIAGDLYAIADQCDEVSARLRGLQNFLAQ